MCDCWSATAESGVTPNVVMRDPNRGEDVAVDACIAPAIENLWRHDVFTVGSCCGHGDTRWPSIILDSGVRNLDRVQELIAEVDDRKFELMQWRLTLLGWGSAGVEDEV